MNGYSQDADRREAEKQAALFTPDGGIEVFQGEPGKNKATALIKEGFGYRGNLLPRPSSLGGKRTAHADGDGYQVLC